jgi:outer membrane protein insertion porin family/translocation and assembly module TamA
MKGRTLTVFPLAAALLCASPLFRAPLAAQRDATDLDHPEVRSLTLTGVHAVDGSLLEQSIATSASECRGLLFKPFCLVSRSERFWHKRYLDRTELRRDVLRIKVFYWKRGYRDTQVDTTIVPDKGDGDEVKVTFRIQEGPPTLLRAVRVERPPSVLPDERVAELMLLRAGKPFDLVQLDSSLVLLRNAMWEKGYADAIVDTAYVVNDTARVADVTVTIDPRWLTRVGSIAVLGNEDVSARTIRTSLSFKEGDIYRRSDVTRSQRRLWESQLFRRAAIVVPPKGDSLKQIEVTVAEAPHNNARVSGGFNTTEFVQLDGRYTRFNFIGGARRLDLQLTLGNLFAQQLNGSGIFTDVARDIDLPGDVATFLRPTWQASAEFTQPWFFSPQNSFGVSAFTHRRSAPGVFIDRGFGANASFTRQLTDRAPLSIGYHFELTRVEAGDVYFCVNYGVCDPRTIGVLRQNQKLSPIAVTGHIDRSNDPFSPTKGYVAQLDLEHASGFTGSDFRYNRAAAEGSAYMPLGRNVLAGHVRVGWVRSLSSTANAVGVGSIDALLGDSSGSILHPRKRFYAGGARSVRGYGENQLGPRVLTLPASKLRFCTGLENGEIPTLDQLASCDLSSVMASDSIKDRDFLPRPLGGSALLEGSVEFRFPIWDKLSGAAFVDGALVGAGSLREAINGAGALTPGFGVRYQSPVGPIRVDLGYNPSFAEDLPVVTEAIVNGQRTVIPLRRRDVNGQVVPMTWRYDPTNSHGGITGLLNKLTLHLSIGQAY